MSDILAELGLSQEEMTELIVKRAVEKLLTEKQHGDEGESWVVDSDFKEQMKKHVTETVTAGVKALAERHIIPGVVKMINEITLTETNKWGEKKGEPLTFTEYLIERAEHYMKEEVDYEGKTRAQSHHSSWKAEGTRVAHMVHKHLHYSISTAMKAALENANSTIVEGLEKAVKIKLNNIAEQLQVSVKTK